MFSQISAENKDAIMGLMRSAGVCLNIILTDDLVEILSRHTSMHRIVIASKPAVIANILEILTHEKHVAFIRNLTDSLTPEQAALFNERLQLVRSLPTTTKLVSGKLLQTLESCELDFISQLWALIAVEDASTQLHCGELLTKLRDNDLADVLNHMSAGTGVYSATYGATYNGPYSDIYSDHPYSYAYSGQGYAYLWGSYIYGQESPDELETISRRLRLQQIFTSGMRNHEMMIWRFKDKDTRFTLAETDAILADAENCQGADEDERIFRATAHMTVRSHATFVKLTRT